MLLLPVLQLLNFYPAIIEAYIQRIPLIICTADRPAYLRNSGANQTINQDNIYSNHIKYFIDFGLPVLSENKLHSFISKVSFGINIAINENPGPVHFNFPFKKPLEPNSFTDKVSYTVSDFLISPHALKNSSGLKVSLIKKLISFINKSKKPLVHLAWGDFDSNFYKNLVKVFEQI